MKILFSPVVPLNEKDRIRYIFEEDKITCVMPDGTSDIFDFEGLPDGELELYDPETGKELIDTVLEFNPIDSAKKENGILYVKLVEYISLEASKDGYFPDWIDHRDYNFEGSGDPEK